jgi:hypothetical protein
MSAAASPNACAHIAWKDHKLDGERDCECVSCGFVPRSWMSYDEDQEWLLIEDVPDRAAAAAWYNKLWGRSDIKPDDLYEEHPHICDHPHERTPHSECHRKGVKTYRCWGAA